MYLPFLQGVTEDDLSKKGVAFCALKALITHLNILQAAGSNYFFYMQDPPIFPWHLESLFETSAIESK